MLANVTAHKTEPLAVKFANGRELALNPGDSGEIDVTGDQLGYIEALLAGQALPPPRGSGASGGGVACKERDESEKNPPKGSKKHRTLHPEDYEAPAPAASKSAKSKDK